MPFAAVTGIPSFLYDEKNENTPPLSTSIFFPYFFELLVLLSKSLSSHPEVHGSGRTLPQKNDLQRQALSRFAARLARDSWTTIELRIE